MKGTTERLQSQLCRTAERLVQRIRTGRGIDGDRLGRKLGEHRLVDRRLIRPEPGDHVLRPQPARAFRQRDVVGAEEDGGAGRKRFGVACEQAAGVEAGAEFHAAFERDPAMRRPEAVEPAEARRCAHRPAGIAADAKIGEPGRDRRRRSRGGASGNAIRRGRVDRRAEMRVHPVERPGEFVCVRLADELGSGIEQRLHGGRRPRRHLAHRKPGRAAAGGAIALDVEEVLHRQPEAGERPLGGAGHLHRRIRHESMNRIVFEQHRAVPLLCRR